MGFNCFEYINTLHYFINFENSGIPAIATYNLNSQSNLAVRLKCIAGEEKR